MHLSKETKLICLFVLGVLVTGCAPKKQAGAGGFPTPEVGVVSISSESLPMTIELPGRIESIRTAEVRARVNGILLKQIYKEGSEVKAGDVLFQIDPAPLQASYDNAQANLAKAKAAAAQLDAKETRFKALVDLNAVSKQEFDDVHAGNLQAQAEVQAAKAAADTASLNLGYATVTAPISGHIGVAKVTEGALVSQTAATPMAMIQQMDPIYCDFTQSSTEVLRLRRSLDNGELKSIAPGETKVTLLLDDGTTYQAPGKLLFSDLSVDPSTGMVTLRAEFPNPDHILLPGMFARVRLEQAINNDAITVLQRGVALGPNGTATVMVVTGDNKVEAKTIKLSSAVGDKWIVKEGLSVGDRVIVEGLQKIRPGATVKTVPFNPSADNNATPPSSQGKS